MKCNSCNKEIEDNSPFCIHCGAKYLPLSQSIPPMSFRDRMRRSASLAPSTSRKHIVTATNVKIGWTVWWPVFIFNLVFNMLFKALVSGTYKKYEFWVLALAYIVFFAFLNRIVKNTVMRYYKIELNGFIAWPVIMSAICLISPVAIFKIIPLPPEPSLPAASSIAGMLLITMWLLLLFASSGWAIRKYLVKDQTGAPKLEGK